MRNLEAGITSTTRLRIGALSCASVRNVPEPRRAVDPEFDSIRDLPAFEELLSP